MDVVVLIDLTQFKHFRLLKFPNIETHLLQIQKHFQFENNQIANKTTHLEKREI